jgi:polygalacturonase
MKLNCYLWISLSASFALMGCQTQSGSGETEAPSASITTPNIPDRTTNILDFGAADDGKTDNSTAFANAINACAAAGGGHVIVPPGTWFTGRIRLKSNIDLHVDAGAVVQFSPSRDDYPLQIGNYEGLPTVICVSPLSGDNLHDVSITGAGIFDGHGEIWRPVRRNKVTEDQWDTLVQSGGVVDAQTATWYPTPIWITGKKVLDALKKSDHPPRIEDYRKYRDMLRPPLVCLSNSRNLVLDGPTFRNSPSWNVHLLYSEGITIRHVTIFNPYYAQNGDGIDIDSCRRVLLTDSSISAGDDVICLKSGRDAAGRRAGRPTENVTIARCALWTGHGGIAIGSEMSGGVRNVEVYDCTLSGTDNGIWFKTVRGRGGIVQNINIHDIEMWDIKNACVGMDMYYMIKSDQAATRLSESQQTDSVAKPLVVTQERPQPVVDGTPQFRDITIRNIVCHSAGIALQLRGLPELPLKNITIEDVQIFSKQGGAIIDADQITLRDVHIETPGVPGFQIQDTTHLTMQGVDDVPHQAK